MKTQVIATLANYAYGLGKKVLLVAPGKKALDELVKRCKNVFGLDIPSKDGRIKAMITSGLLNRLDYKDPDKR
jgi:primosomal protein N'